MDTPWDRLVIPKIDRLVGLMTPKCFLDKVLARGLINRPEYIVIKSKTAPEQVRDLLIELLPTRPTSAYEEFRQVLEETPEQRHLLEYYFPPDEGIPDAPVVSSFPLRESGATTATEMEVIPSSTNVSSIIRAVVAHGADQYFSIGRELGLHAAQITATVAAIPTSAGKLQAIIERHKAAVGDESLAQDLLAVCGRLPTPILSNVRRQLIG